MGLKTDGIDNPAATVAIMYDSHDNRTKAAVRRPLSVWESLLLPKHHFAIIAIWTTWN